MKKTRWFIAVLGLLGVSTCFAFSPILSIVPSSTSLTTRSDSQTSVIYTVTNNSSQTLKNLSINLQHANGLTIQNDLCSGSNLPSQHICQFGVIISGANQPSSFNINPIVKANGGQVQSSALQALTVHVYQITQPAYAYFLLTYNNTMHKSISSSTSASYALLPINTTNNVFGTALTGLFLQFSRGPVASLLPDNGFVSRGNLAVSLDGSQVYVGESPNADAQNLADIAVISAGPNSQVLTRIPLPGLTTAAKVAPIVSPNDQILYAVATDATPGNSYSPTFTQNFVFAINLKTSYVTTIASINNASYEPSAAISPDGSALYVTNITADVPSSISVIDTSTNAIIATISNDAFSDLSAIIVSPDGSTLYAADAGANTIFVYSIGADNTYALKTTINIDYPNGMAISGDGDTLYVSNFIENQISKINTTRFTTTLITSANAASGLSLTPDNNQLFIAPEGGSNPEQAFTTAGSATAIDVSHAISGVTSSAILQYGSFVN